LRAILEEVLLNVMYELPSRNDVGKCVIDRQVVLEKVNPTLVPRVEPPPNAAAAAPDSRGFAPREWLARRASWGRSPA